MRSQNTNPPEIPHDWGNDDPLDQNECESFDYCNWIDSQCQSSFLDYGNICSDLQFTNIDATIKKYSAWFISDLK